MSTIINIRKPVIETNTRREFIAFINQNNGKYKRKADYINAFNEFKEPEKRIKRSTGYWIFKKLKSDGTKSGNT